MKCNECYKELNEMTVFCDRCGSQITLDKMELSYEIIEKNILPLELETVYTKDHQEEIKNGFFLSNIRKDFRGHKRRFIEQYIDYVLLRTFYEKNKRLLTTAEYPKEKALTLLNAFYKRKLNPSVTEILKEEYSDDYENRVIPITITDNVEKVFLSNYDLKHLNPSRFFARSTMSIIISTVKSLILFGIIGSILYIVLPMAIADFDLLSFIVNNQYIPLGLGGIILLRGILKSRKNRYYYSFEDIIDSNVQFKKHIKLEMKKKIKILEYRVKRDTTSKKKKKK